MTAKALILATVAWLTAGATPSDRVVVQMVSKDSEPAQAIVQRSDGTVWMMSAEVNGRLTDDYQIGTAATLPASLKRKLPKSEVPIHFVKCGRAKDEIAIFASATLKRDSADGSVDRFDRLWFFNAQGQSLGRYAADFTDEIECVPHPQNIYVAVTEGMRNTSIRLFRAANGRVHEVLHPDVEIDAHETDDLKTDRTMVLLIQLEDAGVFADDLGRPKTERTIRRTYILNRSGSAWRKQKEVIEYR